MKTLAAFSIIEKDGKTVWNRIGVATRNRDGSLNLLLDVLPTTGRVHVREVETEKATP